MGLLSGRNGPERTGRRLPITGGASRKRCARTLASAARRARSARHVLLASLVMAAILGPPGLAHADPPGRVWLFAFVDGQTRIDLQWSRNRNADPPVQDHKIEACKETADNDCHDADDADWTTLVQAHPQAPSPRNNKYTHTGLSERETWHYRVWSRNTDLEYVSAENRGEATATTESMPMHMDESDNPDRKSVV